MFLKPSISLSRIRKPVQFKAQLEVDELESRVLMTSSSGALSIHDFLASSINRNQPESASGSTTTVTIQHVFLGNPYEGPALFSNYDATTLDQILFASYQAIAAGGHIYDMDPIVGSTYSPGSPNNHLQEDPVTVTYSATGGLFNVITQDQNGATGNLTSSFTFSGTTSQIYAMLANTLFIPNSNLQGNATISATSSDSLVTLNSGVVQSVTPTALVTRSETVPVAPYDDGSYEASLQNLKIMPIAIQTTPVVASGTGLQSAGPLDGSGVVSGIDWSTAKFLQRTTTTSTDPGTKKSFKETGEAWSVNTTKGNTVLLFYADPLSKQPAATQKIVQDPSYNCHGFSFEAKDVVCPDGKTRSFQIVQDSDVKTILKDAYKEITAKDAATTTYFTNKLVYVFFDADNNAIHSAINWNFSTGRWGQNLGADDNGDLVLGATNASSKNGDENLVEEISLKALAEKYSDFKSIKIYARVN